MHIETNSLKLKVDWEFFWIGIVKNGVNFEHIFTPCSSVFIVNFEKVNTAWAQEGIHGLTDFLHVDTNSRKLKVTSMIFGVREVKIGCGVLKFNSKTCCIPRMIMMK